MMTMKTRTKIKYALVILMIISGIADLISTLWHKNLILLENNFIYNALQPYGLGTLSLFALKILVIGTYSYLLLAVFDRSKYKTAQYTYVFVSVMAILLQFGACIQNINVANNIAEKEGYSSFSEVPLYDVMGYAGTPEQRSAEYISFFSIIGGFLLIPIGSFYLWEKMTIN